MTTELGHRIRVLASLCLCSVCLAKSTGCGRCERSNQQLGPDLRYSDLRLAVVDYLMESPVARGQALLLEEMDDTSFDAVVVPYQERFTVNKWIISSSERTMEKVFYIHGPETYIVTVAFQPMRPKPRVQQISVTVASK